jgi:hypothetical protein
MSATLVIGLFGITGEMDLADMRQREVGEIFARGEAGVGRGERRC